MTRPTLDANNPYPPHPAAFPPPSASIATSPCQPLVLVDLLVRVAGGPAAAWRTEGVAGGPAAAWRPGGRCVVRWMAASLHAAVAHPSTRLLPSLDVRNAGVGMGVALGVSGVGGRGWHCSVWSSSAPGCQDEGLWSLSVPSPPRHSTPCPAPPPPLT